MYTIFYDTGNDLFFSCIANAFCTAALKYIARHSEQFMQPGGEINNAEKLKNFLEKESKGIIAPLNCGLFSNCPDQDCKDNYRAVLTSDQVECYSRLMTEAIKAFYLNPKHANSTRGRTSLQEAFQGYHVVSKRDIKQIPIFGKDTAKYKKADIKKYKNKYMEGVKKMLDKEADPDADIFVYVRASIGSHYNFFLKRVKPPNLKPCDHLQVV